MELSRTKLQTEKVTSCDYYEQFSTWTAGRCLRPAEFEIVSRGDRGAVLQKQYFCAQHYELIATPLRPHYPDGTAS